MNNNPNIPQQHQQPAQPPQQRQSYSSMGGYNQMGMTQQGKFFLFTILVIEEQRFKLFSFKGNGGGYRNDTNLSHRSPMTEFAPLQQQQGMHQPQHLGPSGLSQSNPHNSMPNSLHHISNSQLNIPSHISSNSGSIHSLPHYQSMHLSSNIPQSSPQPQQTSSSLNLPHSLSHASNVHSAPIPQQHGSSSVHQSFSSNTLLPPQGSSQLSGIASIHHSSSSGGVPTMNHSLIHQSPIHSNQTGQLPSGMHQSLVNPSSMNISSSNSAPVIPTSSQTSSLQSNSSTAITTPAISLPIANSSSSINPGASDDELYWQKVFFLFMLFFFTQDCLNNNNLTNSWRV